MTTLETVLVLALAFCVFWAWQNWPAILFAVENPTLVTAGGNIASGLYGLGVIS